MPRKRVIDWNDDFTAGTAPDGTKYMMQTETIRYEPKWWYALRYDTERGKWMDLETGDQGHTKMGQVARCEKDTKLREERTEP